MEEFTPVLPVTPHHLSKKWWIIMGVVVLLGGAGLYIWKRPKANQNKSASTEQKIEDKSDISGLEGRYIFSGTTVLDRTVVKYANGDPKQPWSGMDTFGKFDAGLLDLECPVTDAPNQYQVNVDSPHFNCRPDWLPAMKPYYQIVKLAGNHTFDKGAAGFTETRKHLEEAGFQTVGHYNPHAEPDKNCEVVSLPVRLKKPSGDDKANLPIAFCVFNYKTIFSPEPGELELIERYAKTMPVFGLLQAGAEYQNLATPEKIIYSHKMIDLGSEFVIGNGAHGVQQSEVYKDKLIVYSLGNFIFDQIDYETMRGASIVVDMSANYDDNVAKWIELGEKCSASQRADDCLKMAENQGLKKISLKYSFEAIANTSGARRLTKKADAILQKDTEARLNWSSTLKALGQ